MTEFEENMLKVLGEIKSELWSINCAIGSIGVDREPLKKAMSENDSFKKLVTQFALKGFLSPQDEAMKAIFGNSFLGKPVRSESRDEWMERARRGEVCDDEVIDRFVKEFLEGDPVTQTFGLSAASEKGVSNV